MLIYEVKSSDYKKSRAFGWIQDPSDLKKLTMVVAIFSRDSDFCKYLRDKLIPNKVQDVGLCNKFIAKLSEEHIELTYRDLVGTSYFPRSSAKCDGIIQAAIKGQKRDFISDWPADNFLRWAHAVGFVKYNYFYDTFSITDEGLKLVACSSKLDELLNTYEKEHLKFAMLSYPPAVRVLQLLEQYQHLTKFEIGSQLGFIGESGFTSLPQNLLIRELQNIQDAKERNKIKTDWEGTSDKYARMISSWLMQLNLVEQKPKEVVVKLYNETYKATINQSYIITLDGIKALKHIKGTGKLKKIKKNISFEMFCTKENDRNYLRTRRSLILKGLIENKNNTLTLMEIFSYIQKHNVVLDKNDIVDDILGLQRVGIDIEIDKNENVVLKDQFNEFTFISTSKENKSDILQLKENLRDRLDAIPHTYLSLIDLAFNSKKNREFEIIVVDFLTNICGFKGKHLGNSRKPDGFIFTIEDPLYGIIIDTKAYKKGYSLPISQADEMIRYINEYKNKDKLLNKNEWWADFPLSLEFVFFLFISGKFFEGCSERLLLIKRSTLISGATLDVVNLLLLGNEIQKGTIKHKFIKDNLFNNNNIDILKILEELKKDQ